MPYGKENIDRGLKKIFRVENRVLTDRTQRFAPEGNSHLHNFIHWFSQNKDADFKTSPSQYTKRFHCIRDALNHFERNNSEEIRDQSLMELISLYFIKAIQISNIAEIYPFLKALNTYYPNFVKDMWFVIDQIKNCPIDMNAANGTLLSIHEMIRIFGQSERTAAEPSEEFERLLELSYSIIMMKVFNFPITEGRSIHEDLDQVLKNPLKTGMNITELDQHNYNSWVSLLNSLRKRSKKTLAESITEINHIYPGFAPACAHTYLFFAQQSAHIASYGPELRQQWTPYLNTELAEEIKEECSIRAKYSTALEMLNLLLRNQNEEIHLNNNFSIVLQGNNMPYYSAFFAFANFSKFSFAREPQSILRLSGAGDLKPFQFWLIQALSLNANISDSSRLGISNKNEIVANMLHSNHFIFQNGTVAPKSGTFNYFGLNRLYNFEATIDRLVESSSYSRMLLDRFDSPFLNTIKGSQEFRRANEYGKDSIVFNAFHASIARIKNEILAASERNDNHALETARKRLKKTINDLNLFASKLTYNAASFFNDSILRVSSSTKASTLGSYLEKKSQHLKETSDLTYVIEYYKELSNYIHLYVQLKKMKHHNKIYSKKFSDINIGEARKSIESAKKKLKTIFFQTRERLISKALNERIDNTVNELTTELVSDSNKPVLKHLIAELDIERFNGYKFDELLEEKNAEILHDLCKTLFMTFIICKIYSKRRLTLKPMEKIKTNITDLVMKKEGLRQNVNALLLIVQRAQKESNFIVKTFEKLYLQRHFKIIMLQKYIDWNNRFYNTSHDMDKRIADLEREGQKTFDQVFLTHMINRMKLERKKLTQKHMSENGCFLNQARSNYEIADLYQDLNHDDRLSSRVLFHYQRSIHGIIMGTEVDKNFLLKVLFEYFDAMNSIKEDNVTAQGSSRYSWLPFKKQDIQLDDIRNYVNFYITAVMIRFNLFEEMIKDQRQLSNKHEKYELFYTQVQSLSEQYMTLLNKLIVEYAPTIAIESIKKVDSSAEQSDEQGTINTDNDITFKLKIRRKPISMSLSYESEEIYLKSNEQPAKKRRKTGDLPAMRMTQNTFFKLPELPNVVQAKIIKLMPRHIRP